MQIRNTVFLILTFLLLFLGGLGVWQDKLIFTVLLIFILFTGHFVYNLLRGKVVLKIPKSFFLYLFSLLLLSIPTLWSVDRLKSTEFILLFASGAFFWLFAFNNKKFLEKNFLKGLITLGIFFLTAFFAQDLWNDLIKPDWRTLVVPATDYHHHLGDFWAVVLVAISFLSFKKRAWWHFVLIAIGLAILVISLSRSAYLAFFVGSIFLWWKIQKTMKGTKWIPIALAVAVISLFAYAGLGKTLIFSRPYFPQALYGFLKYPFGIGLGNFGEISKQFSDATHNLADYSSVVHNIVLETLVGSGIFALGFIYWFIKTLKEVLLANPKLGILYAALFLTITINFLFDTTYFILTMLWLWFVFLGLSQEHD